MPRNPTGKPSVPLEPLVPYDPHCLALTSVNKVELTTEDAKDTKNAKGTWSAKDDGGRKRKA
jgi:hypothetical protein